MSMDHWLAAPSRKRALWIGEDFSQGVGAASAWLYAFEDADITAGTDCDGSHRMFTVDGSPRPGWIVERLAPFEPRFGPPIGPWRILRLESVLHVDPRTPRGAEEARTAALADCQRFTAAKERKREQRRIAEMSDRPHWRDGIGGRW